MITDLRQRFPVDRTRSMLIGDKPSDMEAASRTAALRATCLKGGNLEAFVRNIAARARRREIVQAHATENC